ncbi:MAG: bifunctional phosphoribosyl-AMP cyclohydrolase/phosphoribosyl-ATP diphosphatase HisIE [Armatimonadota bacterium]|nr:bifunctional phosphoribosyl-AMP cyclohydrolase/phosphoribosyl-ATP diphosphatase HisIE [Armatimonadota bacterium]MDR7448259.1 bifunctional phosphoribosyl-AMP cyclohydrolase/phosphoribosyl-ATP diphosphatase HisIE [Armatimonadota bacterium]MDR7458290.1 bifunctional phosphoribosyl-AMP cyclohydrolase/phosphoribosyl-ATP diphosphatase HisIE [Armatimonadota bacterium]MDR7478407.1 bifunctional phosphoribosyl-AMP cyclohydrolase/phosphoribosyl-ATP diphosphatase HisIE [Armatimonadota bacterium]MDR748734
MSGTDAAGRPQPDPMPVRSVEDGRPAEDARAAEDARTRAVQFGPDGLLPVVAQEARTGRILMVAWMNAEALARTLATGQAWYWSRRRAALWRKGETSGHTQTVREVRVDCDGDALLLLVDQTGPACHTGEPSCFFRAPDGSTLLPPATPGGAAPDILDELFALLVRRRAELPAGSYTTALLRAGRARIGAKVREEAGELVRAAVAERDERVAEEAADLLYHTLVLLVERGVSLEAVRGVLRRRRAGRGGP